MCIFKKECVEKGVNNRHIITPQVSPLRAYLFLILLDWGLIQGGLYKKEFTKLSETCHIKILFNTLSFHNKEE